MRTRTLLSLAAVGLALGAAGCGGSATKTSDAPSSGGSGSADVTPTTAAPATPKVVSATAHIAVKTTPEGAITAVATRPKPTVKALSGKAPKKLIVKDLVAGTGPPAKSGDPLTVNYLGALAKNGTVFDTSWKPGGSVFPFTLGQGMVIAGWDKGLVGMKVGGRRELIIPADLAYGAAGQPPTIPADAALIFIVDLESIG